MLPPRRSCLFVTLTCIRDIPTSSLWPSCGKHRNTKVSYTPSIPFQSPLEPKRHVHTTLVNLLSNCLSLQSLIPVPNLDIRGVEVRGGLVFLLPTNLVWIRY